VRVVLLHAFPLDERMWEGQLDTLAGIDVRTPRLYGRGRSMEDWAGSVLREVAGDGPTDLILVGASMGGYCALEMARQAPDRVDGILLAGSRAGADTAERRATRDRIAATLREHGVAAWYEASGNPAPREIVLEQDAEELAQAMEVLRDRRDASEVVASFPGGLLLVVGTEDDVVPVEEARALVESAPDGRLEVFPGAGHFVSLDRPERFNQVLASFLSRWT
jgi:pimeloyl-ACP methyl ester carboxylesterase